ncbi:MAG TPA: 50S ribosomal protein L21 [Planctomycetaceae bacterium]|nr:50S ribosomal protein L21 [Planctomycetaceae bacterium]
MFAIIEDGSHQYRVQSGETLTIDFRADVKKGDPITFDRVLLANAGGSSAIGRPLIEGAAVEAVVVTPLVKGPKLEIQKFRRRKNSRRHTGHRQKYTSVRIVGIDVPGLEIVERDESVAPDATETEGEEASVATAAEAGAQAAAKSPKADPLTQATETPQVAPPDAAPSNVDQTPTDTSGSAEKPSDGSGSEGDPSA